MKKLLYLFLFFIYLTSCTEKPSMTGLFKKQNNEPIKISQIKTDSIRNPYIMNYHNGMLIFGDIFQPQFISIFNGETGDFLGNLAPKGIGPDEFIHLANISCTNEEISLWDVGKLTLTFMKVDPENISSPILQQIKIKEDTTLLSAFQVIPLQKDYFVATGIIKNHRFALLDKNGNILNLFGDYPKGYRQNNTCIENGSIYQSLLSFQKDKKVLAAACGIGESIMFYDMEDKNNPHLIKEFTFDHPQYELTGNKEQPITFFSSSKNGIIDMKPSSDYCICLFSGKTRTDSNNYGGDKILLFDWNGNPAKLISLAQEYNNLAVDEVKKRIILFGTNPNTGDYIVNEIKLPG